MRNDLDSLMLDNNIEALLVTGPALHNPSMVYLTGTAHLMQADLIKKRGRPPVLFHNPMERDEAAKSGLETRSYSLYPWKELMAEAQNDRLHATVLRYARMLQDLGINSGRLAVCGKSDLGWAYALMVALQQELTEIEILGNVGQSILLQAMATKDMDEIEHIRRMGQITVEVVARTAEYLSNQRVCDGMLYSNGHSLTVGDVKRKIRSWLVELGAENPEEFIFSIGRDSAVPHSTGTPQDNLVLGQTIIFDLFPCEVGGGYFFDFTRTWCLGYAPDDVLALYDLVFSAYKTATKELRVGEHFHHYQQMTCDMFEDCGHPTIRSEPQTEAGFVHNLGHGLGLHIHELPMSSGWGDADDILKPGMVFTMEPGLYYPERKMGVRLEDTFWVAPDGSFEKIAEYPYDLVLPVKNHA